MVPACSVETGRGQLGCGHGVGTMTKVMARLDHSEVKVREAGKRPASTTVKRKLAAVNPKT